MKTQDLIYKRELLEFLQQFITENRAERFKQVIRDRTRYITVALENIYQPHNASAVLRSCECLGIQDVHIIENNNIYEVNPDIALGSTQWLTMTRYNETEFNTPACIKLLKEKGYKIVATSPHSKGFSIEELPVDKGKLALFFGNELHGLSETVKENADEFVAIPMYGFTESYNISVSAALCLYTLIQRMHRSGVCWQLSEEEAVDIKLTWMRNAINKVELLEKEFLKKTGNNNC